MVPEWIIVIISVVIGTLTGFWLNLWRDKLLEKKRKTQEALEKHFKELGQAVILEVLNIISGVINDYGTLEASTLRGNRTMDDPPFPLLFGFEERNEYQAFQTHYPDADKIWRELITKTWEHNNDVDAALKEIEEYINNDPDLPPIKPYDSSKEEKVIPATIRRIYQTIYSISQGQRPRYDFSKLRVSEYSDFQHISIEGEIIAITTIEKTDKCKSAFLKLQSSDKFKSRALGLGGNAFQIMMRFKALYYKLNDIYSYGLVSNKEGHKFEYNKKCEICNKLFH